MDRKLFLSSSLSSARNLRLQNSKFVTQATSGLQHILSYGSTTACMEGNIKGLKFLSTNRPTWSPVLWEDNFLYQMKSNMLDWNWAKRTCIRQNTCTDTGCNFTDFFTEFHGQFQRLFANRGGGGGGAACGPWIRAWLACCNHKSAFSCWCWDIKVIELYMF
jgi:hypothetical protein